MQLNARCKDLEGLAGPKHSAIVRDLLEKEKTVQSKIAQIASSRGQSAQGGGIRRVIHQLFNKFACKKTQMCQLSWKLDLLPLQSSCKHNNLRLRMQGMQHQNEF